jgi:hypothetical protein
VAVAAVVFQQQGIADIVQRRAVLPGRQRAAGGPGDLLKIHGSSFRAPLKPIRIERKYKCDVDHIHLPQIEGNC